MRVNKKQLLGFGGLAFVVGLTTVAYNLPTNATSAGGAVQVQVEVYNINLETVIESPLDGAILTDKDVTFSELHSNADNVKYYLTYIAEDGTKTVHELTDKEVSGTELSGRTTFVLDLENYGGSGRYIFRSVATKAGGHVKEDQVQFIYAAVSADQDDVKATTEELGFKIDYSAGVKSLVYQIIDKNGNAVSGKYIVATDNSDTGGTQSISLNLVTADWAKDLASGRYNIVISGYSTLDQADGSLVGTDRVYFDYKAAPAPTPEPEEEDINVPDTGSILAALNISKADFLITGLIGFSLISLGALLVIRKSHKK